MRRTVHTIITLLIVLVLLFVIFRLMPGDPTRFFIRPGQTEADRQDLLVSFGFAKRVPAPGNGFTVTFETSSDGTYEIDILVNDSSGLSERFHYFYTKQTPPFVRVPVLSVNVSAVNGDPAWDIGPGEELEIRYAVANADPFEVFDANVTVSRGGSTVATLSMGASTTARWTPTSLGSYSIVVIAQGNRSADPLVGYAGAAVNPPSTDPFSLVEARLSSAPLTERLDRGRVTINVTSSAGSISRAAADVRSPIGDMQSLAMFHPTIVVENSILEEFWTYMTSMLVGDFGRSLYSRRAVWDEISIRVGPSLLLFGTAVIISYLLGILFGAVLAWRRGSKLELSSIVVSLFFYSMPVFWFGLILLWAFAFTWPIFPLGGFGGVDSQGQPLEGLAYAASVLHHMALPLLNLVVLSLAGTVLLMRNSMLEVMGEDYITTAKAKGITERRVLYRHAARNAMLPVVTAFALSISGVISGGVLTETIFSWPGMGFFLVQSTLNQDFPSVQGAFFLLALLTIIANLVADVLYAYLDPRVRL